MNKIKVTLVTTIRNKTNGGEYAKQVVRLLQDDVMEDGIHITKFVLVDSKDKYKARDMGFAIGRSFKGKTLMQQRFIIKVSSFQHINNSLNQIINNQ